MLHPLIITLTPWLPTHTAPMAIVSVPVTSCVPLNACASSQSCTHTHTHITDGRENADRVILSAITAGLLEEWTPITANQTEPNTAPVHQPPFHPAATTPNTPLSRPGSTALPLVIAVRRPVMCHKWDKRQRLGDAHVGGCEWVAMTARARERGEVGAVGARGKWIRFIVCLCLCVCVCVCVHLEVDFDQLGLYIYDFEVNTSYAHPTYTEKETNYEAMDLKTSSAVCLSTRFHLFPWF